MTNLNLAIKQETKKNYSKAIFYYLKDLDSDKVSSKEIYINLAFLYWLFSTDYGFSHSNNISKELVSKGESYLNILNDGIEIYPNDFELMFWKKYMKSREIGEGLKEEEYLKLMSEYQLRGNLIPYFVLSFFNENKYAKEIGELLILCSKLKGSKYAYIKAIIESSLRFNYLK